MSEFTPQSVLEDYESYLSRLPKGLEQLVQALRDGRHEESFNSLKDLSEGITWLVSASNYLKASEIEVEFDVEKVKDALNEINAALTAGDYLLVADILEYELYEYFNGLVQN